MSILIKGMEMPKEQALRIMLKNGQLFVDNGSCFAEYEAVEVPTPHGRLIDADEFRKVIEALPNCYNGFSDTYDKACIIGLMDEHPTIIEAEEAEP